MKTGEPTVAEANERVLITGFVKPDINVKAHLRGQRIVIQAYGCCA